MPRSSNKPDQRQRLTGALLVVALALACALSAYLLGMHIQYAVEGQTGGLCDLSPGLNCNGVIASDWSTLFGFPLPIYALGFYAGLLILTLVRAGVDGLRDPVARDITVIALLGGVAWSLVLLFVMITVVGVLCPICLVLDATGIGALLAASSCAACAPFSFEAAAAEAVECFDSSRQSGRALGGV